MRQRTKEIFMTSKMNIHFLEAESYVIRALDTLCDLEIIKIIPNMINNKVQYTIIYKDLLTNLEHFYKLNRPTYFNLLRYGLALKGYEVRYINELVNDDDIKYEIIYKLTFNKGINRVRRRQ